MGSIFTFILLIVAMGCATSIIQARYRHRHGITKDWLGNEITADHPSRQLPAKDEELRQEVEELRDRVKVLERIVTDGRDSRSLAEQIESLRDR